MDNAQLLENYSKQLGSRGYTRNIYLGFVKDFLDYAAGSFDRETIDNYLERLRRKNYSDGTINLIFRTIRTFFHRNATILNQNGFEWPFRRGDTPQIREAKVQALSLHPRTIQRIIEATRENGKTEERAFLALSTTDGLRRIEMMELAEEDIRLKDRTIHIATAKHGRERTHLIPIEIMPYLEEYDFDQRITESALFVLWYRLEYKIALRHIPRVGWHSVRRTLDTILGKSLSDITVSSFMRWKQRTSTHMPFRYSAVRFVGEESETTEVVGEALNVDTEVFQVHPFIEFWR